MNIQTVLAVPPTSLNLNAPAVNKFSEVVPLLNTSTWGSVRDYVIANPLVIASLVAGVIALAVGFMTFFGVMASLRAATLRMKAELAHSDTQNMRDREHTRDQATHDRAHSSKEAHEERIATMRRAVYLEALAEMVKAQMFLGGLAKQDLTKIDIQQGFGGFLVAVARVSVVGEQETAAKARSMASMFNKIFFKGLVILAPLASLKSNSAMHERFYAATQAEIGRILAALVHHNETGKNDLTAFDALQRSFETQQKAAKEHSQEHEKIRIAISNVEIKYAKALIAEMKAVSAHLDDLACAIRVELGIETDLPEFKRHTAEIQKELNEAIENIFAKVA